MTFKCIHCEEDIHGVVAIHGGEFMHHRCAGVYVLAKVAKTEEIEEEIEK